MGLHDGHRQRMRQQFLSHGPQSMADHELLELALFYAIPRRDTNETAHRLLEQFGSLDRVLTAPEQELEQVEGVGQNAAVLLRLIGAMGDRVNAYHKLHSLVINRQACFLVNRKFKKLNR